MMTSRQWLSEFLAAETWPGKVFSFFLIGAADDDPDDELDGGVFEQLLVGSFAPRPGRWGGIGDE